MLTLLWYGVLFCQTGLHLTLVHSTTKQRWFSSNLSKLLNRMQRRKTYLHFKFFQEVDYFLKYFIFNLRFYSEYISWVFSFIFQNFISNLRFLLNKTVLFIFKQTLWINLTLAKLKKLAIYLQCLPNMFIIDKLL